MFALGVIENWINIYEFDSMSLFSVPLKVIGEIIKIFSVNFTGVLTINKSNYFYIKLNYLYS
jgi:hypothetical protein